MSRVLWTEEEKQALREWYPQLGAEGMVEAGYSTRSVVAVKGKAQSMRVLVVDVSAIKRRGRRVAIERGTVFYIGAVMTPVRRRAKREKPVKCGPAMAPVMLGCRSIFELGAM